MNKVILFENKDIRRIWSEERNRWLFAVVDIVAVLSESRDSAVYWRVLKHRLKKEAGETVTICNALKMPAADGKMRMTDVADVEQLLRIVQSVPSPKAEPFKRWLAKVGHERLQEIENPELAQRRMKETYRQKGYSDAWIEKRLRGIAVRDELTDEWKKRGVRDRNEFSVLTAEISRATFGMSPSEYRDFKALGKSGDNLRDHMSDLELIFTMLGEASTTEIARNTDAQGMPANRRAAKSGGTVAGNARRDLERKSGRKVSTPENFLEIPESRRRALGRHDTDAGDDAAKP